MKKGNKKMSQFGIVFKKEILDLLRDTKSVLFTFIVPLIMFPIIFVLISIGTGTMVEKAQSPKVAFMQYDATSEEMIKEGSAEETFIKDEILKTASDKKVNYKIVYTENPVQDLIEGKVSALIKFEKGFETVKTENKKFKFKIVSDERAMFSAGGSVFESVIGDFANEIYNARLNDSLKPGVSAEELIGVEINNTSIEKEYPDIERKGVGNFFMQLMIPLMLVTSLSVGSTSVAVDIVAGEKERNTFESLLSTCASRFSIMSAKFLVTLLYSFVTVIIQIAAILIALLASPELIMGTTNFNIPFGAVAMLLINMLLFAALFTSILLVLSSTAKNYKEASIKLSFVGFIPIVAIVVMFLDAVDIGIGFMFVPVLNVVALTKMILSGYILYGHMFAALGVNLILACAAIWFTLKMFNNEKLITRG